MPQEQLKKLQSEKLVKQVQWVWDRVPYYRTKMEAKGVTPADIKGVEDLHKLPFLSKDDLRDQYPAGLLAVPLKDCVRIHSTSGTTGRRVVVYYTQHDVDLWYDCCARAIMAAGGTEDDVCQVCYGYGLFTGGLGLDGGSHKVGCLTLPMSTGNTDRQLQFMLDMQATILSCTPSYAAYLGESLKEAGYTPDQIPLKAGIFGAEPWTEEMRQDIQNTLGIKAYDIYGLTEMSGPGVAYECEEQHGMHVNEDHFLVEVIDPDTGEQLPDGAKGELVFTSLPPAALPHPRHLHPGPHPLLLRPHPRAHDQAHGPQRRHADHPRRQRLPLPDRDRTAAGGLSAQLSHPGGPGQQYRYPGHRRGAAGGAFLRHRARGGGPHQAAHVQAPRYAGHPGCRPFRGSQEPYPQRRQGQAGHRQP